MTGNGDSDRRPGNDARRWFAVGCAALLIVFAIPIGLVVYPLLTAPACGCTSPPTHPPGWTPTPPPAISLADSADRASRLAGVTLAPAKDWLAIGDTPVSEPSSGGIVAFVDGNTGTVLEVVFENRLPASDTASISADAATGAAEAFLTAGGATTDGLVSRTGLVRGPAVAYFDVAWSQPEAGSPDLEVLVNSAGGDVFVYRDLRSGPALKAPVLSYTAAAELARQSPLAQGETPQMLSVEDEQASLEVDLNASDGHAWMWLVGFPDGVLFVDATAGDVWVAKWSAR
jgi:hypothetical protein